MRNYELIFIVHPEVDDDGVAALIETVKGLVERGGGQVARVEPWGLRRLAYPIRKVWEGQYVLMRLDLEPQGVAELERSLGLTEQILRHLVMRVEGEVLPEGEEEEEEGEAEFLESDADVEA